MPMTDTPTQPPPEDNERPLEKWWDLEEQKTLRKAVITYLAYALIVNIMDALIVLPFQNETTMFLYNFLRDWHPSLLINLVICLMFFPHRIIEPPTIKISCIAICLVGGVFAGPFLGLLPIIYLLQKPLATKEKNTNSN